MAFVDQFGNKSAGELIRAELWNGVMAELDGRFAPIDAALTDLAGQVATLSGTVGQVQTDLGAVTSLITQYFKVSLSTTRVSYATGEEATIVAELRNLRGEPMSFADAERPWIDFVTVWGHLRPAEGFESESGDSSGGERGISVRTNGAGVAQAHLRAQVGQALPHEVHADVAAAMTARLPDNRSVAQAILEAPTPADAKNAGAFAAIAAEYDRPAAKGVRSYLDTYYVDRSANVIGKVAPPIIGPRWFDYASIVVAVARSDADPTTPDQARGAGSIRVAFRDWIGPWIMLQYLDPVELQPAVVDFRAKLAPHYTADYLDSVARLKNEVGTLVSEDRGLVGRIRDLQAVHGALDGVSVGQPAALVEQVTRTVQQAVVLQQAIEPVQAATFAATGGNVAIDALTDSSAGAATDVGDVKQQLAAMQSRIDEVGTKVDTAEQSLATLDGRVSQASSTLSSISSSVSTVQEQVTKVQAIYPDTVKDQFLELQGAVLDVQAIKEHLRLP